MDGNTPWSATVHAMVPKVFVAVLVLLVVVPFVIALASVLWVRAWKRSLAVPEPFDELVEVTTADGIRLIVGRCLPVGTPSHLPPVVVCHGFAMNRRAMAFDANRSFARMLAARGRDVWAVELRGAEPGFVHPSIRNVSFDTHAAYDVPAVLDAACAAAGVPAVDWVGFSMGGLLAYAHLGALKGGRIRRLVTLGAPVRFNLVARTLAPLRHLLALVWWSPRAPFGFLAMLVAPWTWPGMPTVFHRGLSGRHYDGPTLRRVMANTLADSPMGVTEQFMRWILEDKLTSVDGARDYLAGLEQIDVPSLVIAGSRDRLAPAASVRLAYERIRASEKSYIEVGPASGARHPYDHLDLIVGRWSPEEVFPHVARWLDG